ncbi:MAG TPA: hypothetical protein VJ521_06605, partial [Acidobacteriota bacterium]|nr:hypothetical protein [Acidobacteriota bacterium]
MRLRAAAVICILYILGARPDPNYLAHEPSQGIRAGIDFLTTSFGPVRLAPLGVFVLILMLLATAHLLLHLKKGDPRVFGFLAGMISLFTLTAGIAIGRGGQPNAAASWRYITLTASILCYIYLVFTLYGGSGIGRYVPTLLTLMMAVLFPFHIRDAINYGSIRRTQYEAFEKDVLNGFPDIALAARNVSVIYTSYEPVLPEWVGWMRKAKIGPFRKLQGPPWEIVGPFKEEKILIPSEAGNRGTQAYLAFSFPQPRFVEGIQFTFIRFFPKEKEQSLKLFWGNSRHRKGHTIHMWTPSNQNEQTRTVWVYDTIDRIRIDGHSAQFELLQL